MKGIIREYIVPIKTQYKLKCYVCDKIVFRWIKTKKPICRKCCRLKSEM